MAERMKANYSLPESTHKRLKERAERDAVSASEALHRAIWVYALFRERQDAGASVVIRNLDGKEETLILMP